MIHIDLDRALVLGKRALILGAVFLAGYCARDARASGQELPAWRVTFDSLEARARRGELAWQSEQVREYWRRREVMEGWPQ